MQPQGKMPFLDQGGVQIVPLVTPLPSGLQSSCCSLHFGRPCSAAVGAPWLWQSHRFFLVVAGLQVLSPATASQNHGSTLKWQASPISGLAASCWGVLETIGISSSFANLFFGSTNSARERPAFSPAVPPAAPVWQTQPQQLGWSLGPSQNFKILWFIDVYRHFRR